MDEEDLLRFMKKEEVDNVLPLFEGAAETGKIKRKSLKNWLVSFLTNYFPTPSMPLCYYLFFYIMNFLLIQLCDGYLDANNISKCCVQMVM